MCLHKNYIETSLPLTSKYDFRLVFTLNWAPVCPTSCLCAGLVQPNSLPLCSRTSENTSQPVQINFPSAHFLEREAKEQSFQVPSNQIDMKATTPAEVLHVNNTTS